MHGKAGQLLRLVALGAAIGIPAALAAALFLALVHTLEHWLWTDLPARLGHDSPPWFLIVGLPLLGALIVLAARRWLPGDGGHKPLDGLSSEPTPFRYVPGVILAALGTLGFGAVLGPEAPVIALGSAIAMLAAHLARAGKQASQVLSTAGGLSAISALFGGPVVAGILIVEGGLGMGTALLPVLIPGMVAAAIGYLIFVGFGDWGGLNAPGLVVPDLPRYDGVHLGDLLLAIVVGVACALLMGVVRRFAERIDQLSQRRLAPILLGGALLVGLIALMADWLGANSQDVLFSGQASLTVVATATSAKIVVLLLIAKGLAYAICLGCGFRGGPIFPAIFLGVALASLGVVFFHTSPTLAIAVGAAAGMAAQTRLLISPLVLSALLVGSQGADAVPAAVIASAAAWVAATALHRRNTPAEPAAA